MEVEKGQKLFAGELLREVGRQMDGAGRLAGGAAAGGKSASSSQGMKSIGEFLGYLAAKLPAQVLQNLTALSVGWDSANYQLRSAMCALYSHLIHHLVKAERAGAEGGEGAAEARDTDAKTREQLCEQLLARQHDVNSFSSSAAIAAWNFLAINVAVPLSHHARVTQMAEERINDKSSNVRKAALRLLGSLIAHNPFGAELAPGP